MKKIANKHVLITGGASGIGRLLAFGLAEQGAQVSVWDLNAKALEALAKEALDRNLPIKGFECDVSKRETVYKRAEETIHACGPVDILVNNAGIVSGSSFLDTPDERILKSIEVNLLSSMWTTKAFLPGMIERNSGHLVTISSAAGIIGVTGLADYSATKFGVFGFHEAVRMELRRLKKKVKTTVVCPFFIDTGMFDGVKTRFSLLLPILKSEYAARQILKAIVKGRKRLIMPAFVHSIYLLRLLPVAVFDAVADFFGVNRSMDHFKGRV